MTLPRARPFSVLKLDWILRLSNSGRANIRLARCANRVGVIWHGFAAPHMTPACEDQSERCEDCGNTPDGVDVHATEKREGEAPLRQPSPLPLIKLASSRFSEGFAKAQPLTDPRKNLVVYRFTVLALEVGDGAIRLSVRNSCARRARRNSMFESREREQGVRSHALEQVLGLFDPERS